MTSKHSQVQKIETFYLHWNAIAHRRRSMLRIRMSESILVTDYLTLVYSPSLVHHDFGKWEIVAAKGAAQLQSF